MRQSDAYLSAARLLISSYFLLSLAKCRHEIAKAWSTIRRQNVVVASRKSLRTVQTVIVSRSSSCRSSPLAARVGPPLNRCTENPANLGACYEGADYRVRPAVVRCRLNRPVGD